MHGVARERNWNNIVIWKMLLNLFLDIVIIIKPKVTVADVDYPG